MYLFVFYVHSSTCVNIKINKKKLSLQRYYCEFMSINCIFSGLQVNHINMSNMIKEIGLNFHSAQQKTEGKQ